MTISSRRETRYGNYSMLNVSTLDNWQGRKVLVVGDVMLDRFVYGNVERVSPEAPVPVLHFKSQMEMLGGAANVARNVVSLGGQSVLIGVVGDDEAGRAICGELATRDGVETHIVKSSKIPTTVKTRFVANGQQIMRLDVEVRLQHDLEIEDMICASVAKQLEDAEIVVLSDYAKGTLSEGTVKRLISMVKKTGKLVVVDPKVSDVSRYSGASVITPNALEAAAISGVQCSTDESAERAARLIMEKTDVSAVLLTRSAQGMTVFASDVGEYITTHIPTTASEVFDVSGAGDTVVAALALALSAGESVVASARIANLAAGVSVSKPGTSVVLPHELRRAVRVQSDKLSHNIFPINEAALIVNEWKKAGLKVGFTNGCYDLIHPGHVALLKQARATCDRLVVGLNTDNSVRRLKGDSRPVQSENARAVVMSSIDSVDLVVLFDEDTPLSIIDLLDPDVLIKGADYSVNTVVGADLIIGRGGKVVLVPLEQGHSTTSIIERAHAGG
ncbi:D-glycero-beta-D-manno-heptose-7-phosphate kinase [Agrobacterium vitis]